MHPSDSKKEAPGFQLLISSALEIILFHEKNEKLIQCLQAAKVVGSEPVHEKKSVSPCFSITVFLIKKISITKNKVVKVKFPDDFTGKTLILLIGLLSAAITNHRRFIWLTDIVQVQGCTSGEGFLLAEFHNVTRNHMARCIMYPKHT